MRACSSLFSFSAKQKFKWDTKGALWKVAILAKMAYLAKMSEMAINRQNRQSVNKNSSFRDKVLIRNVALITQKLYQ